MSKALKVALMVNLKGICLVHSCWTTYIWTIFSYFQFCYFYQPLSTTSIRNGYNSHAYLFINFESHWSATLPLLFLICKWNPLYLFLPKKKKKQRERIFFLVSTIKITLLFVSCAVLNCYTFSSTLVVH